MKAKEIVEQGNILFLEYFPYLRTFLANIEFIEYTNMPSPAMISSKFQCYYNPIEIERMQLTPIQWVIILMHELEHLLRRHPQRYEALLPNLQQKYPNISEEVIFPLLQIATNCEINDDLINDSIISEILNKFPLEISIPKDYGLPNNLSFEEYLDLLLSDYTKYFKQKFPNINSQILQSALDQLQQIISQTVQNLRNSNQNSNQNTIQNTIQNSNQNTTQNSNQPTNQKC